MREREEGGGGSSGNDFSPNRLDIRRQGRSQLFPQPKTKFFVCAIDHDRGWHVDVTSHAQAQRGGLIALTGDFFLPYEPI